MSVHALGSIRRAPYYHCDLTVLEGSFMDRHTSGLVNATEGVPRKVALKGRPPQIHRRAVNPLAEVVGSAGGAMLLTSLVSGQRATFDSV